MKRNIFSIVGLVLLRFRFGRFYRLPDRVVNLMGAGQVGPGSLAILAPLWLLGCRPIGLLTGALSVYASASLGVPLIVSAAFAVFDRLVRCLPLRGYAPPGGRLPGA